MARSQVPDTTDDHRECPVCRLLSPPNVPGRRSAPISEAARCLLLASEERQGDMRKKLGVFAGAWVFCVMLATGCASGSGTDPFSAEASPRSASATEESLGSLS